MNEILLVEDEQNVAELVIQGLEEDGYKVIHAMDGLKALEIVRTKAVDLVILDILLPQMNGLDVCKAIRDSGYTDLPVLMLTALGSPENVVLGLDNGADDYMSKPFKLIELKARIRTLLRRKSEISKSVQSQLKNEVYRYSVLKLDDYQKVAYCNDQELNLTSTEYRLLLLFMRSPKKVFMRSELLDEVWGINFDIGSNVVDVYVNYLRRKIEKHSPMKLIHTVIGMGYVLKGDE
ncbi:response regulator receiver domain protein [Sphingobacterium spiritivorum ATCC 33300]|uniref:Response regulator receiver domain protein n=1 Tax=Sphingobacterium spiritivorum ATCC 33300 TaxID=525372 RepID=C2FW46_SPHSI|nr:response regulator transcription factor [Sphingobacterium spiritivorum]EEI92826.1 response regulator receiver domain protein [Sphingobacterium spiritivorum ATCC 33300]QQS96374.1 response regulator transcription factor [Sphingobacterium spiritivorum]